MSTTEEAPTATFQALGLSPELLRALDDVGYESPTPIQDAVIPLLLGGRDVVGQAATGTGKTGAFALPILQRVERGQTEPQALVLVPTRELAIQVSEAFQKYATHMPGFHVLPVYGGQSYEPQLRQLRRATQVVVGTPGRLADHLRRGTLDLAKLRFLVIDEADEMLRMGFLEEVEFILGHTPEGRQTALFSATMPEPIRRIASRYMANAAEATIRQRTATASTIRQRYWMVAGLHKLDALTRILEGETFDAMLVFVRTKTAALDLARRLEARGFACAPLNGDVPQREREATVEKLRNSELDIIVATDVAARGLDVARVSHVVNYDIPTDYESYIHRIGRTGRAGRAGEAILFVAPRERRLLQAIEKATRQPIALMELPSAAAINDIRVAKFKQRILDTLAVEELGEYQQIVEDIRQSQNIPAITIAAALAKMAHGEEPLLLSPERPGWKPAASTPAERDEAPSGPPRKRRLEGEATRLYRLDVGHRDGVRPSQIVGAIANEAGVSGEFIGAITIRDTFSFVELPAGLPDDILELVSDARVCGRPLRIREATPGDPLARRGPADGPQKPRKFVSFRKSRGDDRRG